MNRTSLLAGSAFALLALTLPARNAGAQAAPQAQKTAAPKVATSPAPPAPPNAQDPPAEKVFKNVKVLTGMPASQMIPVMQLMRSSLGVGCGFCHVTEGNRFDLDTKEEKGTAREMVKMVFEINKNNFDGHTEVTCMSCHHGQTRPVAVPPIGDPPAQTAQAAAGTPRPPAPGQGPEGGAREVLPTAAQVLDHAIEALGGRTALAAVTSRVSRGTVLRAKLLQPGTPKVANRGEEDPLEIVQPAPGRLTATVAAPAGKIVETLDGTAGTVETPAGRKPLDPLRLRQLADDSDLHREITWREHADKMRVVGKDEIDGREVYVVRGATADGRRQTLYFEVQSGLLARRLILDPLVIGATPEQIDYSDYRDAGGVKVPFVVKASYLDDDHLGTTRKLAEVRNNPSGARP
jgi:hypothetical protein